MFNGIKTGLSLAVNKGGLLLKYRSPEILMVLG